MKSSLEKDIGMGYNIHMKKEKKVFLHKYNAYSYVLFVIICVVLTISAVVNFLKFFKVGESSSYFPGLELSVAIISILLLAFISCFLLLSRYVIVNGKFYVQKLVLKEIPVEKMLYIRVDKSAKLTVLYYADEESENDGISFAILSVNKRKEEELIERIQELNSHISVERV